jgi:plastocyanin
MSIGMKKSNVIGIVFCGLSLMLMVSGCHKKGNGWVPKTDTVVIENMQFNPTQLNIREGDTVIWINKGIVAHNVTEDTAKTWTSGDINVGATWKTVPEKGFHYLCTVHPTMKGSVTIIKE